MFHLSKWYFDCVTPEGSAFLGYSARLDWGALIVNYGGLLASTGEGAPLEFSSFVEVPPPTIVGGALTWHHETLGISARYVPTAAPISQALFNGQLRGKVEWDCVAPKAEATINIGENTLRGTGYVEHLTMQIEPWKLPCDTLRWGRFTSGDSSIVWLDFRGAEHRTLVFENGREVVEAIVSPDTVALDEVRALELGPGRLLRDAPIVGQLRRAPQLMRHIPLPFTAAHETKWLSRAALCGPERHPVTGWAIHELVKLR